MFELIIVIMIIMITIIITHPDNAKGTSAAIVDVSLLHAVEIEQIPAD